MPRGDLIQVRKGTAAEWSTANPVLAAGELGLETDTGKIKGGNGTSAWTSLPYSGSGGGGGAVDSVNGRTGAVTLTKSDVGLSNADNTTDLNKPVSTAVQTALNLKADATALTSGLNAKQDTLVSGVNIKTVNGNNLLGAGNVSLAKTISVNISSIKGVYEYAQTITDADVTAASKILITLGTFTDDDENNAEMLNISSLSATPNNGSFDVILTFSEETNGIINLNYMVA